MHGAPYSIKLTENHAHDRMKLDFRRNRWAGLETARLTGGRVKLQQGGYAWNRAH